MFIGFVRIRTVRTNDSIKNHPEPSTEEEDPESLIVRVNLKEIDRLHYHIRAIENDSFVIRSANKGISAIVDNSGRVIKSLKSNESGSIEYQIPKINSHYKKTGCNVLAKR